MKKYLALSLMLWFSSCDHEKIPESRSEILTTIPAIQEQHDRQLRLMRNLYKLGRAHTKEKNAIIEKLGQTLRELETKFPKISEEPDGIAAFQQVHGTFQLSAAEFLAARDEFPGLDEEADYNDIFSQWGGTTPKLAEAIHAYNEKVEAFDAVIAEAPLSWVNRYYYKLSTYPKFSEPRL